MVHFVSLLFACLFLYKTVPASAFIKHTGAMCLSQQCELVAFYCKLASSVTKVGGYTDVKSNIYHSLMTNTIFYNVFVVVCTVCHICC